MLKLIDPDQALELVLAHSRPADSMTLPVAHARGLVLDEDIEADRDYPPFSRAMMDGYAVCAADAGQTVALTGEVAAGQEPQGRVSRGSCLSIMTGAACPEGTEAVVMIEETELTEGRVTLPGAISPGQHIAPRGSECGGGAVALARGIVITPLAEAVLAAVGRREVAVIAPPSITIISTGNELLRGNSAPGQVQIRDTNGPMLASLAVGAGVQRVELAQAEDTPESLAAALERAAEFDLVLLAGGVSAGKFDLVPEALRTLGTELIFHKVTQKPGKPLLFGKRGAQLFFGLPGNPLSCHFCWHRYVRAAVGRRMGLPVEHQAEAGILAADLQLRCGRTLFLLARVANVAGRWEVTPRQGQGSADIFSGVEANALVRLEAGEHRLEHGTAVTFQRLAAC